MDFEGATAFLLAARTADADLMRLLLELGADPTIPNTSGTTALLAAAGVGVQSPKEDPGSPEEVYEAVTVALEVGCDVNKVNSKGESVMHGAAYKFAASIIPLRTKVGGVSQARAPSSSSHDGTCSSEHGFRRHCQIDF